MDYRKRKYYLIKTNHWSYTMRHEIYKLAAPSIKYHSVQQYGSFVPKFSWLHFTPNEMISCLKEDTDTLEYELRKAHRRDGDGSNWIEITKELIGQ